MYFNYLTLLFLTCFSMNCFAAQEEFLYQSPRQGTVDETIFHELVQLSHDESSTFQTIQSYFQENQENCHQFQFKQPLKDKEHADLFKKVLRIKAREPQKFVPVITSSERLSPTSLGFMRQITIGENELTVQEHVVIDQESNACIFIEELVSTSTGVKLGSFTASNAVVEEAGQWYFVGTYLYSGDVPNETQIYDKIKMFRKTYENMEAFLENEDLDVVYTCD